MTDLSYKHGATVVESAETPSLLRVSKFGIGFCVGTAPDANATEFPLNVPVTVTSLSQAKLLSTAGTLLSDVEAFFGEGGTLLVITRVEHSETPATLQANLIGTLAAKTGIYSVLRVSPDLGLKPRVIFTAGDTGTWIENGVVSIAMATAGSNLTEAPTVTASGGGSDPDKELPNLTAVWDEATQTVTGVTIVSPGKSMTEAPTITFSGGGSHGSKALPTATANVGDAANPFVSALATVTEMVRARAYISGPNTTDADAVRFRKTINSGRILVIDPKGIKNVAGVPVTVPIAPVFAGVRSRVVASNEGVSGSVSNKEIRTLDGVARTVAYPTDSNYLNGQQVSTVINERGGLRTWGSRLAYDKDIWQFDSVRATADMINEALEDLYFLYVDRKFTKGNLKMMVEDGNAAIRVFRDNEDVLGGKVWLSDLNQPTLNANGKVFLDVEFEPTGIMEQIGVTTHRNIVYYTLMLDEVRGALENGPLTVAA